MSAIMLTMFLISGAATAYFFLNHNTIEGVTTAAMTFTSLTLWFYSRRLKKKEGIRR